MATSGRSCRSRKRRREATFGRAAGCRRAPATGARDARGRSPGHCWRARIGRHRRGHRRPRRCRHRSARRRAGMGRGASRWSHRRGHGRGLADRGPPRSSKSTNPGCIRPTPSTTESSRTRGLVGARRRQASPSSAARRGRPERHSPCVAKQERQARQDGFRADRGAAQCVADWVGLGAWNVGNPWLGRVFARRGERWLTRSFV
jgi:hypothetical protein